jgi:hypothetical protein
VKIIALAAWLTTAAFGLYLFAVWLIEHDGSKAAVPPAACARQ